MELFSLVYKKGIAATQKYFWLNFKMAKNLADG